ncbi:GAD-like domain-containing protein [Actinomadura rugatobispora]|uniref:GAD-like domain-containing protein n=1 Tax=Actinomadura rugatobispora TaxID=1994 RepID=A0ABW1AAC5_9ACTN|nr:hypothetical protein GCM10010200_068770 [Actinomadura rugatobispora]
MTTDAVIRKWGVPFSSVPVPGDRYREFGGRVPDALLEAWRKFGFAGFAKGLWWLCDPVAWQPAVDTWTADLELDPGPDRWCAVTRSAFGQLSLWGDRTGMALTINPVFGTIFPDDQSDEMDSQFDRDLQLYSALLTQQARALDIDGDDEVGLFDRVLERLGPVGPDTMYAFAPVPALGGPMIPENVEIADAEVHMQILSETTPRQIMANPYR